MNSEKRFKSYKPVHSLRQITGLTEKVLGSKVESIQRKDLGEINVVYFATLANGLECVIRVSPKEREYNAFALEAWAFKKCREVGVPTPDVLAVDTSPKDFPEPYLITKKIPGLPGDQANLTEDEKLEILYQLGHYLSLIHTIKVSGFGRMEEQNKKFVGKHRSLWEYIRYQLESGWWLDSILSGGLLPKEKLDEIKTKFEENKSLFEIESASLNHGDVSFKNIIVEGAKITGIVDMENALVTDPTFDFCYFHFWSKGKEPYFSCLKDGYDNKSLFDNKFMKKLYFYQLLLALSLLAYYNKRGRRGAFDFVYQRIPVIESELDVSK